MGYIVANCTPITIKPFRVCIGDMRYHIKIYTRSILPSTDAGVDFGETFTDVKEIFAMVETTGGETVFDETNTARVVTHNFYARLLPNVSEESWVEFRDKYYDILSVEHINERKRFMLLKCCLRGTVLKPVNFA